MSKLYRGELQDNLGNTIYPHTEAGLVFCADGETVQQKIAGTAETLDGITGVSDSTELDDSTKLATSKAVKTLKDSVNSSLIGYPDMSQKIYRSDWQKSFAWTATQDCWVYGACDTRTTTYASIICLNDAPVVSALTDNSTIAQSGSLFICKKGDVISKTVNGDSIARIDVYAMRDFTV